MNVLGARTRIAVGSLVGLAAMAVSAFACPLDHRRSDALPWPPTTSVSWRAPSTPVAPRAEMTIAQIVIEGALEAATLRRAVRRSADELAACWDLEHASVPISAGTTTIVFRVAPDGTTTNVAATGKAATCVGRTIDAIALSGRTDEATLARVVLAFRARPEPRR